MCVFAAIPSFYHRSVRCPSPLRRGYGGQRRRDDSVATSGLKECQQVDVELVFVRVREAVGCPRVDF